MAVTDLAFVARGNDSVPGPDPQSNIVVSLVIGIRFRTKSTKRELLFLLAKELAFLSQSVELLEVHDFLFRAFCQSLCQSRSLYVSVESIVYFTVDDKSIKFEDGL